MAKERPLSGKEPTEDREEYFDDYWAEPPRQPRETLDPRSLTAVDRERYYARRDAYYAERDAYYAERDAYYARRKARGNSGGYADDYDDDYEDDDPPARRAPRRRKRRRRRKPHVIRNLFLLLIIGGLIAMLLGIPPIGAGEGTRFAGRSAVLLAVVAEDGYHTDAVFLVTLEQKTHAVRVLELPGDMHAENDPGLRLDEAYGVSGGGRPGARGLMNLCGDLLSFAPDGYLLLDGATLNRAAAIVNGAKSEGFPTTASEAVEFLKRVFSASNMKALPELWRLMRTRTETDLTAMNFCWAARVLVKSNPKTVNADVLPGELIVTSDGAAYRTVDRKAAYTLLRSYSPFVL